MADSEYIVKKEDWPLHTKGKKFTPEEIAAMFKKAEKLKKVKK